MKNIALFAALVLSALMSYGQATESFRRVIVKDRLTIDAGYPAEANDYSILTANSTTKGILIPRMTTAQRDAIAGIGSTERALLIFNTTTGAFNFWDGSAWQALGTGGGGGGDVASVFGRTGAVTAQAGDYSSFYPSLSGSYSNPTWIASLAYSKLTGTPTIPAQFNPIAGTGMSITGTYPNMTFNSTASGSNWTVLGGNVYRETGNVGIGTNNPSHQFTVYTNQSGVQELASFRNAHTSGTTNIRLFNNVGTGSSNGAFISLYGSTYLNADLYNSLVIWNFQNGPLRLGTNNAERIRINTDGSVKFTNYDGTAGGLPIVGADGTLTRLNAGTNGQVLKIVSGVPAWAADELGESGGGITSLNGLTGSSQTFALGTGTLGWSSSSTTHTLNIPDASGSVKGLLTAANFNTFNGKQDAIAAGTTAQYWRGDKSWQPLDKAAVGLPNADNTSDLAKPISTATQTALNGKQNSLPAGSASQYWAADGSLKMLQTEVEAVVPEWEFIEGTGIGIATNEIAKTITISRSAGQLGLFDEVYSSSATTPNNTYTTLMEIPIIAGSSGMIEVRCHGVGSTGERASVHFTINFYKTSSGSNGVMQDKVSVTSDVATGLTITMQPTLVGSSGGFNLAVQGDAGKSVRWRSVVGIIYNYPVD